MSTYKGMPSCLRATFLLARLETAHKSLTSAGAGQFWQHHILAS